MSVILAGTLSPRKSAAGFLDIFVFSTPVTDEDDGFLVTMGSEGGFLPALGAGFHDFAGSTVVHTIGGLIALAGAIVLGPRLGRKFKRDGGGPMLPHDLTIAGAGGLLLWFGWEGERYGLDLHEHGISAYPEYVISSAAKPTGMLGEKPAEVKEGVTATAAPGVAS